MPEMRLLVDGMNVIGSRPDGWWRNRKDAMRRLVEALSAYVEATGDEVTVVLDSKPFDIGTETSVVAVRFAPGGRNAGDDEIVRLLESDESPETVTVATSDRELRRRVEALGASVSPAGALRGELDRLDRDGIG